MKRVLSVFLLLCLFCLLPAAAFADGPEGTAPDRPVLPDGHPDEALAQIMAGSASSVPKRDFTASVSEPAGEFFVADTTWTVSWVGGTAPYTYNIYLTETDSTNFGNSVVVCYTSGSTDETSVSLSYRLLASGNYALWVLIKDSTGKEAYRNEPFSAKNSAYPTVYEKCEALVAEARAAGALSDYELALWMHDWLTANANYDYSYTHYHADGVLFAGSGVCDSYSKAYMILLETAGIQVERVLNDGHSWNAVQLDGKWYYVDVTWDDPGEGGGYENHIYCFVPESVLSADHKGYEPPHPCSSMDSNYYVMSDQARVQSWGNALGATIQTGLQNGKVFFSVPFQEGYRYEKNVWESNREDAGAVLGDLLSLRAAREKTYSFGTETIPLVFSTEAGVLENQVLKAGTVVARVDVADATLSMPERLSSLGPSAFYGNSAARAVIIHNKTTAIPAGTFRNCPALWVVEIPAGVTTIDENAFDENAFDSGNRHLTLVGAPGSQAETFAADNNLFFVSADEYHAELNRESAA